jgi:hypothetical protein
MPIAGAPIYVNLLSTLDKNLDILIPNGIVLLCIFMIFIKYAMENKMSYKKIDGKFNKKYDEGVAYA